MSRKNSTIVKGADPKKKTGEKTLWVTVFKCFQCGKHGHDLKKCGQCSQAYYCDADCQRKHWRKHKPVCQAAVAALGSILFPVLTLAEPGIRRFYLLTSSVAYVCVVGRTYLLTSCVAFTWVVVCTYLLRAFRTVPLNTT